MKAIKLLFIALLLISCFAQQWIEPELISQPLAEVSQTVQPANINSEPISTQQIQVNYDQQPPQDKEVVSEVVAHAGQGTKTERGNIDSFENPFARVNSGQGKNKPHLYDPDEDVLMDSEGIVYPRDHPKTKKHPREKRQRVRQNKSDKKNWAYSNEFQGQENEQYESWFSFSPEVWFFIALAALGLLVALCLGKHKDYRSPRVRAMMRARRANPTLYSNNPTFVASPLPEESVQNQIRFHQMEIDRLTFQCRQEPPSSGNRIISY